MTRDGRRRDPQPLPPLRPGQRLQPGDRRRASSCRRAPSRPSTATGSPRSSRSRTATARLDTCAHGLRRPQRSPTATPSSRAACPGSAAPGSSPAGAPGTTWSPSASPSDDAAGVRRPAGQARARPRPRAQPHAHRACAAASAADMTFTEDFESGVDEHEDAQRPRRRDALPAARRARLVAHDRRASTTTRDDAAARRQLPQRRRAARTRPTTTSASASDEVAGHAGARGARPLAAPGADAAAVRRARARRRLRAARPRDQRDASRSTSQDRPDEGLLPARPLSYDAKRSHTRYGAWLLDRFPLGSRLDVEAGLRFDQSRINEIGELTPRLSLSARVPRPTRLRAAFGVHTQSPGYEKLFQADYALDLSEGPAASSTTSARATRRRPRARPGAGT